MLNWPNFLTYLVVTAITPGPNNIMSMSNGGRLGFKKALPFNLGIWVAVSVISVVSTLFCSILSSIMPKIMFPMLILGASYMLYLAWKTFKSTSKIDEKHSKSDFFSGFTLQFVNAKLYIYCIVSIEAYILPYYAGQVGPLFGFALFIAFIGFSATLCWSAFGSIFKVFFSKYAKITNTIMALLLVYCAASLFH